jgi:uncharacterized protein (DUF1501 family)
VHALAHGRSDEPVKDRGVPLSIGCSKTFRGGLALPRSAFEVAGTVLVPSVALAGGQRLALAPGLAPLMPAFDAGRLGVLMNVGPLVQPTTRAQYFARSVPLPPKLFSHNDQQSTWQSGNPEGAISGWGGRMGDLFAADNAASTFACISTGGTSVFVSGRTTATYQLNSAGPVSITGLSGSLFGSAAASQAAKAPRWCLVSSSRIQAANRSRRQRPS